MQWTRSMRVNIGEAVQISSLKGDQISVLTLG
jgi:hypothetical protein